MVNTAIAGILSIEALIGVHLLGEDADCQLVHSQARHLCGDVEEESRPARRGEQSNSSSSIDAYR